MAGNKKKTNKKKKVTKPNALGLFADALDDEIDLEDAVDHLQEQMDEHVDEIIDDANVEEVQNEVQNEAVIETKPPYLNTDDEDFDFAAMDQQNFKPKKIDLPEGEKAPKPKNFFDMDDGQEVRQPEQTKKSAKDINAKKRPVMSNALADFLEEEEPRPEAEQQIHHEMNENASVDDNANNEHAEWLRNRDAELERLAQEASLRAQKYNEPNIKVVPEKTSQTVAAEDPTPENDPGNDDLELEGSINDIKLITPSNSGLLIQKIKNFNAMYATKLEAEKFGSTIESSWRLLLDERPEKKAEGKQMLATLFEDTLKQAFDTEKTTAYNENRLPEYTEIVKSANELMRASMYELTDLYHDPRRRALFDEMAFGGLDARDMAKLTKGESLWSMDQRSDEAWEIQSRGARNLADEWLKDPMPYEKMIKEMTALVKADKKGEIDRQEVFKRLGAAECLLMRNEKMMVENPEDPINPIPNWGNRYWKVLTQTRESLGIMKHISMRELIQGNYAESKKAVLNAMYNRAQIQENVLDTKARAKCDSIEDQRLQFATISESMTLVDEPNKREPNAIETNEIRTNISVKQLDQRLIEKKQPKNYDSFIVEDKNIELTYSPAAK